MRRLRALACRSCRSSRRCPRPNICCQARLTVTRAVSGLSGDSEPPRQPEAVPRLHRPGTAAGPPACRPSPRRRARRTPRASGRTPASVVGISSITIDLGDRVDQLSSAVAPQRVQLRDRVHRGRVIDVASEVRRAARHVARRRRLPASRGGFDGGQRAVEDAELIDRAALEAVVAEAIADREVRLVAAVGDVLRQPVADDFDLRRLAVEVDPSRPPPGSSRRRSPSTCVHSFDGDRPASSRTFSELPGHMWCRPNATRPFSSSSSYPRLPASIGALLWCDDHRAARSAGVCSQRRSENGSARVKWPTPGKTNPFSPLSSAAWPILPATELRPFDRRCRLVRVAAFAILPAVDVVERVRADEPGHRRASPRRSHFANAPSPSPRSASSARLLSSAIAVRSSASFASCSSVRQQQRRHGHRVGEVTTSARTRRCSGRTRTASRNPSA